MRSRPASRQRAMNPSTSGRPASATGLVRLAEQVPDAFGPHRAERPPADRATAGSAAGAVAARVIGRGWPLVSSSDGSPPERRQLVPLAARDTRLSVIPAPWGGQAQWGWRRRAAAGGLDARAGCVTKLRAGQTCPAVLWTDPVCPVAFGGRRRHSPASPRGRAAAAPPSGPHPGPARRPYPIGSL